LRTIAERQQTQIELLVRVLHGAGKANEKTWFYEVRGEFSIVKHVE
jgi:hypothetical protein